MLILAGQLRLRNIPDVSFVGQVRWKRKVILEDRPGKRLLDLVDAMVACRRNDNYQAIADVAALNARCVPTCAHVRA